MKNWLAICIHGDLRVIGHDELHIPIITVVRDGELIKCRDLGVITCKRGSFGLVTGEQIVIIKF